MKGGKEGTVPRQLAIEVFSEELRDKRRGVGLREREAFPQYRVET
jgi:hypothetical protein